MAEAGSPGRATGKAGRQRKQIGNSGRRRRVFTENYTRSMTTVAAVRMVLVGRHGAAAPHIDTVSNGVMDTCPHLPTPGHTCNNMAEGPTQPVSHSHSESGWFLKDIHVPR